MCFIAVHPLAILLIIHSGRRLRFESVQSEASFRLRYRHYCGAPRPGCQLHRRNGTSEKVYPHRDHRSIEVSPRIPTRCSFRIEPRQAAAHGHLELLPGFAVRADQKPRIWHSGPDMLQCQDPASFGEYCTASPSYQYQHYGCSRLCETASRGWYSRGIRLGL